MLIVMKTNATAYEIDAVVEAVHAMGLRAHPLAGPTRTAIGITGNTGVIEGRGFENLFGVAEVIRVTKPYKLITLDLRPEKTIVRVGDATIGGNELAIIAGPCAIESREQAFAVAEVVNQSGARFFRGGVCKPRTSPYTFQGLGEKGWTIISEIRKRFGLKVVTEALDDSSVALVEQHCDVIQIGRAQHAEFFAVETRRPLKAAGVVETGDGGNVGGVSARGGIHHGGGQLQRHLVRARHSHVRATHSQHARSWSRAGDSPNFAFAGNCRSIS